MPDHFDTIESLLRRVRSRWRRLRMYKASVRAALSASAVLGVALVAGRLVGRSPVALSLVALAAVAALAVVVARVLAPLGRVPDDRHVARFIEERSPSLDDRLVTAVDIVRSERQRSSPAIVGPMLADTARRAEALDPDGIVPADALRRAGFQAVAALLALGALILVARGPAREAYDAAALALFPGRVTLEVAPGNARIKAGTPLSIDARLVGNRAPVLARVEIAAGPRSRTLDMSAGAGGFHLSLPSVNESFTYHVVAGTVTSSDYAVTVAHAPRVARVDVDYTYPAELGLKPRTEEDSGDIYAPAGTRVRLRVHTDRPAATGHMALGDGHSIALASESPTMWTAAFTLMDDNSYRLALADREGMANPGDTEYFIRMLEDRPPDVRIMKPAADRAVTRLEEVDIEAQADDDYGIDRMDLVYSVAGSAEKVVPLAIPRHATTATARHMLSLEDLNVQPGDFVSYYVRARDITRGKRSNETKSDIFFLEVRPYEQEFSLAQSSAMSGAGGSSVDDLVTAQKEIVVATWKLDRRSQNTNGGRSEQDIRSVSHGQAELKSRVERTSSTFRESTMRDPRRRSPSTAPRAGQALPEEDAMTSAAAAMGRAVVSLDALKTGGALPPEMEALNHLLKAQADVKKREVSRQQAGNGNGNNNRNYDMSTLFDKELQKQTQTNYENRSTADTSREESAESALDKIKNLARRQDELVRKQQELARQRESLTEEALKRELEKLTREQSELRQQAEELSRQMNGSQSGQQASGQQSAGKQGQQGQSSGGGKAGGETQRGKQMRDISEEMRSAASDLRRQDPSQATARGNRALEKLRELEQQIQNASPEQRRRALGELQLEARQLADAERQVASELNNAGEGDAARDAKRRLAGEQDRLADRARKLQEGLKQQVGEKANSGADAASGAAGSKSSESSAGANGKKGPKSAAAGAKGADAAASTAAEAARQIEQQQLVDRMQKAADALRAAGGEPRRQADAQQELARSLDSLADKLGAATGAKDGESQKLSEQLGRAQDLKEKMATLSRQLSSAGKRDGRGSDQPSSQKTPGATGRAGEGREAGGGGSGTDLSRLKQEYERQLQQTRELMDELKRDDPNFSRGGSGFTYEGQGMTLSAPGTEAFKQDFARWEQLRQQATQALDAAESTLTKKLQTKEAHDRLAAGVDDKAPPEYQKQVESYFKALAAKKKGG